jgi:DNA replication protein DnaC
VELLIGRLYNQSAAVIVTTNFLNLAPGAGQVQNEYARAMRPETLGDRIGARMFSRLQQMCAAVQIQGSDWRMK